MVEMNDYAHNSGKKADGDGDDVDYVFFEDESVSKQPQNKSAPQMPKNNQQQQRLPPNQPNQQKYPQQSQYPQQGAYRPQIPAQQPRIYTNVPIQPYYPTY